MAQTLLFLNARLIDGLTDQSRDGVSILVTGERISKQVIDGDPLRDVRELRKLTAVYRGGVAHDPQAILAQAPKSDAVKI